MHHHDLLNSAHTLITSLTPLLSPLTDEQKAARKKGLELYNQGDFEDAEADLTIAATAGDSDAQYALGEVIRRRDKAVSDAAKAWYRLAGQQHHVYALMRLGDADSLEKARVLASDLADLGNADGMLQMYELTKDKNWLAQAGSAGSGEALYMLALLNEQDPKLTSDRSWNAKLDNLLRNSAAMGYPPAMQWRSNLPMRIKDVAFQNYWMERRLAKNQLSAVMKYAYLLLHIFTDEFEMERFSFPYNQEQGYGLLWLIVNNAPHFAKHYQVEDKLNAEAAKMTSDEIEAAKKFANTWKKTHPPMSAYNLTYSDLK